MSIQGRHGGYSITNKPENIKIYNIVAAVEDIEKYFGCVLGFDTCSDEHPCALHKKWTSIRDELFSFLNNNTIADVMDSDFNKFWISQLFDIVEKMMHDAKLCQIYEGTNQIQRVGISKGILK